MDKPEKLILDYSKWRCGEDGPNKLGTGVTALLNDDGCMCCLGLWSLQLGASEADLLNKGEPNELDTLIPVFAEEQIYKGKDFDPVTGDSIPYEFSDGKRTTELAMDAILINDETETTPEEKIVQLTELLANHGIALEVINKPS